MNELVVRNFGGVEAVRRYAGALRQSTRRISAGMDDRDILKINDRDGEWTFGQEDTIVERDDLWAVNPLTIKHGYIAFDGKEVADDEDGNRAEIIMLVTDDLPEMDDLPELHMRKSSKRRDDEPRWRFQMALELVCVEGPNQGAQVIYKPTSMGGLRVIRMVSEEIARRLDDDSKAEKLVPVVELDTRAYHNKRYGKEIFNPVFHIVSWASLEDDTFTSNRAEEDEKPATKSRNGKANGKGRDAKRDDRDDDAPRARARDARKEERTAKGDKVDRRRAARDEDDRDDPVSPDEREEPRSRRGRDDDEPRKTREPREPEDAPRGRRGRDRDEDVEKEPEAPRGRRAARDDDEDDRRSARRDKDADDAPRGRRGRDDEDDRPSGPRGRNAERGGRR